MKVAGLCCGRGGMWGRHFIIGVRASGRHMDRDTAAVGHEASREAQRLANIIDILTLGGDKRRSASCKHVTQPVLEAL